jgi:hypothetical protein
MTRSLGIYGFRGKNEDEGCGKEVLCELAIISSHLLLLAPQQLNALNYKTFSCMGR